MGVEAGPAKNQAGAVRPQAALMLADSWPGPRGRDSSLGQQLIHRRHRPAIVDHLDNDHNGIGFFFYGVNDFVVRLGQEPVRISGLLSFNFQFPVSFREGL